MSGTLYFIGPLGSGSGGGGGGGITAYANFASLPGSATLGDMAITTDDGNLYWWNGSAWVIPNAEVVTVGVDNTDSVDLAVVADKVQATLNISSDAATSGFLKATTTVKSGAGNGLHVEIPEASGSQTGVLKSADWTTFNSKEPAITAGTTADYYRGDKTFQPLNMNALAASTGSAPAANTPGEEFTATQATNTATGVAASGSWGDVTSISLGAGDYLVYGSVGFDENGATLTDFVQCGISTSATGVGISEFDTVKLPFISGGGDIVAGTPVVRISSVSSFTAYLNTKFNYSAGGPRHRGRIKAFRLR